MQRLLIISSVTLLLTSAGGTYGASADTPGPPPQGYVQLEGAQARLALAGNLFRVAVREITRSDGSKATVFRDVDYPVRAATIDAPEAKAAAPEEDGSDEEASAPETAAPSAPRFAVWVILGPEYEDPPPPGASPSSNRLRRPGPALVIYEFDGYKESGGTDDEAVRIEMDFSGTHPVIRRGWWSMEAEAGEFAPSDDAAWDFVCVQGAYGTAFGRIASRDLHTGAPDTITLVLVRKPDDDPGTPGTDDEMLREGEGTGTYTLKRKPAAPAT